MQWIKSTYDAAGLTQYPVGPHLSRVQELFGGSVILCLDVSGSMGIDRRLPQAVEGCRRFVAEAISAGYEVGGLLWSSSVEGATALSRDPESAIALFGSARAGGGNDIVPALLRCEELFEDRTGDLVIAIFGDGDLGDAQRAATEASRLAARNIRVLTVGLGEASAHQLAAISTDRASVPQTATSDSIADSIAGMAAGLKRR